MVGIWKYTEHNREESRNLLSRCRNISWASKEFSGECWFTLPSSSLCWKACDWKGVFPLCIGDHSTISLWNDLLCLKWRSAFITITTSLTHDGVCHHRRNLWGGHRYHSCPRSCTCRGLCLCRILQKVYLDFLCSGRPVSLAVRLPWLPLNLCNRSVCGSMWQSESG